MEVFLIVVIFIGWGFVWIGKNEKRIADITEEDDMVIALLLNIIKQAKLAIPKTVANDDLLEQIELVLDEDTEEDI